MNLPQPVPLGLKKSFGFGDRLGLATPGHLTAVRRSDFAPIFAQQSIREMTRTARMPEEVMIAAQRALAAARFTGPWGADADHLKTEQDAQVTAAAGFCFFTIDPSAFVVNDADGMSEAQLSEHIAAMERDAMFERGNWQQVYLAKEFTVSESLRLRFERESLWRAAVKYGRAIAHTAKMAGWIQAACAGRSYEIEISVDETDSPTSPVEHLFFGLELKRRGVKAVSLAPRFIGEFEKGIDYRGDLKEFERVLAQHVAIARFCGPYKLSVHSGSDKFSAYPVIGRLCGDMLHVKTAGTSYLEALRVVARTAPALLAEIAAFCRGRFVEDRKSYHISTTEAEVAALPQYAGAKDEPAYLDERAGRQLLHVTFGSVLTQGTDAQGRPFKDGIMEQLDRHADLHLELLDQHFTKHLTLLALGD